ncbi:MAG: GNAT family N-acetyltransferase, partial [Victivallaceae bacterium]
MQIMETQRLILREMTQNDFTALCAILEDDAVMTAYEGAFSDPEVQEWLDRQLRRYETDQVGLWAVILKESGSMIGQCGLAVQMWNNRKL